MDSAQLLRVTNTEGKEIAYIPVSLQRLSLVNLTCERSVKYVIQHGALPSELSEGNCFWRSNSSGSNATSLYSVSSCAGLEALRKGSAALVTFILGRAKALAEEFML